MSYKYETGVYIGRFQPFHNAHLSTVRKMLDECRRVIISIGSAHRPRTPKNPWSSQQREALISEAIFVSLDGGTKEWREDLAQRLPRIKFIHVRDYMYNDSKWAGEVFAKSTAAGAPQGDETCLYGCFKDDSSYYLKMFPQWSFEIIPYMDKLDSTDIRDNLFSDNPEVDRRVPKSITERLEEYIGSPEHSAMAGEHRFVQNYRAKAEAYEHPITYTTVDVLVIKSGHILMIRRGRHPGKGLWAFPGGFVKHDQTLRQSALAELNEETHIRVDNAVLERSIADVQYFDHPQRDPRGRFITHAHVIDLGKTGPLPAVRADDDAEEVEWVSLADAYRMEESMYADHSDILIYMTARY